MFVTGEGNLREELGLTAERGNELVRIINSIMDHDAPNEDIGRTSHVLLDIASRKDLNDVERVACGFIFACKISDNSLNLFSDDTESDIVGIFEPKIDPAHDHFSDHFREHFPFPEISGTNIDGMIVGPPGVSKEILIAMLMASVTSILRELPKDQAREFCRNVGFIFARMAISGDMKL